MLMRKIKAKKIVKTAKTKVLLFKQMLTEIYGD
jgi:hypothetical protein